MILDIILNIFFGIIWVLTAPFRLLPDATIPDNITATITAINPYLQAVDFIFPVATLAAILGIMLEIELLIFLFKLMNWTIRKLPGIN